MGALAETDSSHSQYEFVGDREHVSLIDGKQWLTVRIAAKEFRLPLVNVGSPEHTVAIAWLDPNPEVNPGVSEAASDALAHRLMQLHAKIVIMPASSKSEYYIRTAVSRVPNASLLRLPADKNELSVRAESLPGSVMRYLPVTGIATQSYKFMGLPVDFMSFMHANISDASDISLVDDVLTTGATIDAMKQVLASFFEESGLSHQVVVLAREAKKDQSYPARLPNGTHAIISLPEFEGIFPADTLIPVEDRFTRGIPRAMESRI